MSVSIGGKIVTDGLVIHYDGLNPRSYPGSGIVWNDLTPYANNGDLDDGNNPVTIQNGYASFTDIDNDRYVDLAGIGEINNTTEYVTLDMWIKLKGPTDVVGIEKGYIFGWNAYSIQARYNYGLLEKFGFTTNSNDIYGLEDPTLASLNLLNNWNHYSFVMCDYGHFSIARTNQKIYINGTNQSISSVTPSAGESTTFRVFTYNPTSVARFPGCRFNNGNIVLLNMDVALVKIYNRELTQDEVTQNFNAHRGRFNIY
jgi:hypothetical protein